MPPGARVWNIEKCSVLDCVVYTFKFLIFTAIALKSDCTPSNIGLSPYICPVVLIMSLR